MNMKTFTFRIVSCVSVEAKTKEGAKAIIGDAISAGEEAREEDAQIQSDIIGRAEVAELLIIQ